MRAVMMTCSGQGECLKDGDSPVRLRGEISFDEITMDDKDDLQVNLSMTGLECVL